MREFRVQPPEAMAGLTLRTAFIIATRNDLIVTAAGPGPDDGKPEFVGRWMGWITFGEADRYRPLVNSDKPFDTEEGAVAAMRELVEIVKKWVAEETNGQHPMDYLFGESPLAGVVKEVVTLSRQREVGAAISGGHWKKP